VKILVVDVGGNKVKILVSGQRAPHKVPSGPHLSAAQMVAAVRRAIAGTRYDRVTVGFPGPVKDNRPAEEPVNLGRGWVRFDYARAFGKPVRFINDAAMQALGSYRGGRMLFLGLGTGLGSALVLDGLVQPLEMAHLPYRSGKTYEDFLGKRGMDRAGKKRWRALVFEIVPRLRHAFQVDEVVLGGGNAKQLKSVPAATRLGDNANAFRGGFRLWESPDRGRTARRRRS
jgi:polyphosphate glucokinase